MGGVTLERSDGIGVITIDRPEKLNALSLAMYEQLGEAFAQVRDDPRIGVAILTGAGPKAFCVGADLEESIPALTEGRFDISEWDAAHQKHSRLDKPVIAAINGFCLGGGFEIMLSTDIRIAAAHATFALPEAGVGVVPAGGTLVRLVRQIPYPWAMDLMLRGGRIDAEQARSAGLVNEVVTGTELMKRAGELADQLLAKSWTAMATIKRAVRELADLRTEDAFRQEAVLGQQAFTSADAREGLAAFAERRRAEFPSHAS
ncbi:enoyl-CoA hydratase/isomerase family protein [Microbacterium horticulturae]|uniref:Enoyl-CoA hydratase/isomerase family protein n=1 Tax=Microbacterium horticulturae TaxID=3028316 RepID=A0ABY8C0B8_9MICO|nr:enoyl-CoA hydratase/isomerase family protein [Microbacterium sp. KACC 23027]WEG08670.1 enoyl-CoA hydratase/isomerase family protein [Microbacterium sp. KACC 23027]